MAAQEELITFYDIPSTLPDKAWSPNTWRARYVLNIKSVPYTTTWLPHASIAPTMARLGASQTTHTSGAQKYTLPAILDLTASPSALADSSAIAAHLDARFPSPPLHVAESAEFVAEYGARLLKALLPLIALDTVAVLLTESRAEWRAQREATFGASLEALVQPDEKRAMLLAAVLGALSDIDAHSDSTGESPYVRGDALSYRDVVVAAALTWARRVLDVEGDVWGVIMEAHGGRWRWLMDRFAQWEVVPGEAEAL